MTELSTAGSSPILRSFPHGAIIVFDQDLRYLSAGGLGLADAGLSQSQLEGRTIFEVFPLDVTAVIEPLYRAALAGIESEHDVVYNGRIYQQRLGPARAADGSIVAGMGFTQDITEHRRVEQDLQESDDRLRLSIEHAPIGWAIVGLDLRFHQVNPAFSHITGYPESELLQMDLAALALRDSPAAEQAAMDTLLSGQQASHASDIHYREAGGTLGWVSRSVSLLRSPDGSPAQYIVQIKDIGERKRAEALLLDRTRRLRNSEAVGHSGSWELDVATRTMSWSDGLYAVFGVDPATFMGSYEVWEQVIHPDDRANVSTVLDACIEHGTPVRLRFKMTRPSDGVLRRCEIRAERLDHETVVRIGGSVVDITDLAVAEAEIRTNYTFQQAVIDASPDLIFAYHLAARSVVWSNRSLSGILGFVSASDAVKSPSELSLLAALDHVNEDTAQLNFQLQDAVGSHRWFSLRTTPMHRDDHGAVTQLVGVLRDITDARQAEGRLEYLALHDSLTGLPNRALLIDRIDGALDRSGRDHREISLLFCDLDGFKRINDTAGHSAGDAVLIETAHRLREVLRPGDTVARVGGDEFIILLEPWNRSTAADRTVEQVAAADRDLAPRVAARIATALGPPIVVKGVEHLITASIGITWGSSSPAGHLRTVTAEEMLQDADAAMYKAKNRGKNRFEVFEHTMRATLQERGRVEFVLRQVLQNGDLPRLAAVDTGGPAQRGRLTAAYQPIFTSAGDLVGFEALARLADAEGRLVPPEVFVAIAEEIGLIRALGITILNQACRQLASWRHDTPGLRNITMAVNVSALQAADGTLGGDVHRALSASGLQPADLVLELTESTLLQAAHSTIVDLRILRDEGVAIAIDDFGIGYASLRYLATLPVSALKIDRSFTAGLPDNMVSKKIVSAVAGLAADLEMTCIVEGVETIEQRKALPPGVQLQGFLTGRPLDPEQLDVRRLASRILPPTSIVTVPAPREPIVVIAVALD